MSKNPGRTVIRLLIWVFWSQTCQSEYISLTNIICGVPQVTSSRITGRIMLGERQPTGSPVVSAKSVQMLSLMQVLFYCLGMAVTYYALPQVNSLGIHYSPRQSAPKELHKMAYLNLRIQSCLEHYWLEIWWSSLLVSKVEHYWGATHWVE